MPRKRRRVQLTPYLRQSTAFWLGVSRHFPWTMTRVGLIDDPSCVVCKFAMWNSSVPTITVGYNHSHTHTHTHTRTHTHAHTHTCSASTFSSFCYLFLFFFTTLDFTRSTLLTAMAPIDNLSGNLTPKVDVFHLTIRKLPFTIAPRLILGGWPSKERLQ